MKKKLTTVFLLFCSAWAFGQKETVLEKGVVSYVSSLSVYVKFANTEGINKGDTLFAQKENRLSPALVVKDKSSTSAVCAFLLPEQPKVGDEFFARVPKKKAPKTTSKPQKETPEKPAGDSLAPPKVKPLVVTPELEDKTETDFKQRVKGRVSAASYSNFYGSEERHQMRYTFTLQGNHLRNSRFSTDNYITFRHTVGEWQEVKDNINNALKVYSLAVKYDFNKKSSVSLGRRINQRIASMGAIDGVQAEKGIGNFLLGGIVGSRPNFADYSFDLNLFQAGIYASYVNNNDNKLNETTLAVVEQRNGGATDRRFIYLQHSNTLLKDLSLFGSMELDLYENIHDGAKSTLSLTNMLLTLRYKLSKKASLSLSYDNRKNIIFYESYKNYIDQLIDDETRQGLRFNINYRPFKWLTWGANVNWRFQKSDFDLSKNLNSYLNFNQIPWIKANASVTVNFLQTPYLSSKMYGLRLNKDIIPGKLSAEVYGRYVDYQYQSNELSIQQQLIGGDISVNLTKKLSLHLYYEGTFDNLNETLHRVNTKLIQRF